ncbi:MAG: putative excisionase [Frankiales bacterium]|nr:putative excisionase [Frankiales bacterium]
MESRKDDATAHQAELFTDEQLLFTPEQAAGALQIGRTTLYALLKEERLHAVHIGRSCRLTRAELLRYVARLDQKSASPEAEVIEVQFGQVPEPDDAA